MKCNAKTRSGSLCKRHSLVGKIRCRLHGGLSPSGTAHWNYRHGHRTKEAIANDAMHSAQLKLIEVIALATGLVEYE